MKTSAGDFDYDTHGQDYAQQRRTDPRIAALVRQALRSARTVLDIGAGAGSYEPEDRYVWRLNLRLRCALSVPNISRPRFMELPKFATG